MKSFASPNRSAVLTKKGIVCSASPLAGAAGAQILREGGNAFDAAIATAAVEGVTIPPMCGMGGEVFALLYQAGTGKLYGVTGSGMAPMGASREYFIQNGYTEMPGVGPLAPSVPGEVHAWETIVERFGTKKLSALIQPAIDIADQGFPLPQHIARFFPMFLKTLKLYPEVAQIYTNQGRAMGPGDVLVQQNLAGTLRRVAEGGANDFYHGGIAREIAESIQKMGGLITQEDLANQETLIYENPPSVSYRGKTVYANDLPSQAYLILEILNIMEGFDIPSMGHNSADTIHVMAEAKKLAFANRLNYVGDPTFTSFEIQQLLSKEFARRQQGLIDMKHVTESSDMKTLNGIPGGSGGNTSYFCVVDSQGNAASFIHSLSGYFGCGVIPGTTGMLLNNRSGRSFYLEENHPNVIAPGKKPVNTIQTYMVFDGDRPWLVGGTPGGDSQPQLNAQAISNVVDFGFNVQQAVDLPRWVHFPGTDPATIDRPFELRLEDGIPSDVKIDLERRGHRIGEMPQDISVGALQFIEVDNESGVHIGATDSRCDGYSIPE